MQKLWAPWRSAYITGAAAAADEGCIFCTKPARGPAGFADDLILCATADAFVILNRFPYNNGHLMVVPRLHVARPADLPPAVNASLWATVTEATSALQETLHPHAINLGMNLGRTAGAGIADHCHVHLVPRWDGDTNFMPVLAETKVISQHLQESYSQLLPRFSRLSGVVAAGHAPEG